MLRPTVCIVLSLLTIATIFGCKSARQTHAEPDTQAPAEWLVQAGRAYEAGDNRKAYQLASQSAALDDGPDTERAQLIAGMAAYRMGDDSAAIAQLTPLVNSDQIDLAGKASATLGLIYAARGEQELSQTNLKRAIHQLKGEERARAYLFLGIAQQKIGKWTEARTHLALAAAHSNQTSIKQIAAQRGGYNAFAIQAGAFQNKSSADRLAAKLARKAATAKAGKATVAMGLTADGSLLYLVRIGQFNTNQQAITAKRRMSLEQAVVVPINTDD